MGGGREGAVAGVGRAPPCSPWLSALSLRLQPLLQDYFPTLANTDCPTEPRDPLPDSQLSLSSQVPASLQAPGKT